MRVSIAVLLLFAILPGIARSQSSTCIDKDPDGVLVGSVKTTLTLTGQVRPALLIDGVVSDPSPSPANVILTAATTTFLDSAAHDSPPMYATKAKQQTGQVGYQGFYWSIRGHTGISIPPGSIIYSGDPAVIDAMSTVDLFDMISRNAVDEAISNGTIPCSLSGLSTQVQVSQAGCVIRFGKGADTRFVACNDGCCTKTYTITCSPLGGSPIVELVSSESNGCSGGGCESTCR